MRYEIPALIVVEAATAPEAAGRATELSHALRDEGRARVPLPGVGIAATGAARLADRDRAAEPLGRHVQRIHERRAPTAERSAGC